jgi:GT2 family glycosyltransferase
MFLETQLHADVADRGADIHASWCVVDQVRGSAAAIRLLPGPDLRLVDEGTAFVWEAGGDYPRFRVDLQSPLPAGWYRLDGCFEAVDGTIMLPCLHPQFAGEVTPSAEIALPDPDDHGHMGALILFPGDVLSLDFCPGLCPPRFRMHDFRLRRVGRVDALRCMLLEKDRNGEQPWKAILQRGASFVRGVLSEGTRCATDRLYEDYRLRTLPPVVSDYALWTRKYDTFGESSLAALRRRARVLSESGPLISVLVPTYNTPEVWLRRCLDSVLAQAWPRWELCLADDASPDPQVMAVLEEYARMDTRIRVTRRDSNGHISAASNTALGMARGDFVALLDHDDELRPHALLEMAEAIIRHPDVQLAYSDEDKLNVDGDRFDPYFKPDWNADLLRSQNYVCHLSVIRTKLVREVGGFRAGFEGSQDHDLILRCTERLAPAQIHHVPKILYHWRAIEGSTALERDSKDYASAAGARAVAEHLQSTGSGAEVEELAHGHFRVRWPLPDPAPKVSLVIPTRDRFELLHTCVESLLASTDYPNFELVVVDNQSSEPQALAYLETLGAREGVRVLRYDAPFNYSAINNWAVGQCDGELIGLVNNDIEVISPGWLSEMASHALRADVGAVGAMLYYPNDTIQHAGVVAGVYGVAGHIYAGMPRGYHGHGARAWVAQELTAVTGACLLVRRRVFDEVGGLDERLQVAFNDIDFCLRLRERGYHNVWTPFAELYHHESASRGSEDTDEKKARFAGEIQFMKDRWTAVLLDDPAYNPNLSLQSLHFDLAFPPRGRVEADR